jgi:hypothetical protein
MLSLKFVLRESPPIPITKYLKGLDNSNLYLPPDTHLLVVSNAIGFAKYPFYLF